MATECPFLGSRTRWIGAVGNGRTALEMGQFVRLCVRRIGNVTARPNGADVAGSGKRSLIDDWCNWRCFWGSRFALRLFGFGGVSHRRLGTSEKGVDWIGPYFLQVSASVVNSGQ